MTDVERTENRARLAATLAHLREPFSRKQIGKLPATAKRPALDFVGHAAVTDRLNRVTDDWSYTVDERFDHDGACWIRITLTVCGTSRVEYGDGDDPKEALGNALRRAAMRFGVAIDLWSREELEGVGVGSGQAGVTPTSSPASPSEPTTPGPDRLVQPSTEGVPSVAGDDVGEEGENSGEGSTSSPPAPKVHAPAWVDAETIGGRPGWQVCSVKMGSGSCYVHPARRVKALHS